MSTNTENAEIEIINEPISVDSQSTKAKMKLKEIPYLFIKRTVDIIGSFIGLIPLALVTIIIYIARKVLKEDNGPLFYEQLRYGKNGKMFRLYKFRSMCMNADKKLKEYLENNPEAKEEFEETYKLQEDPRVTKIGKFLRKTSLDELPQLINVLKGELSLVGCRPVVEGEIEEYGENKDKFLSVKPGITGFWQVNGRSNTSYEDRMKQELYYVDHKSLWLDFKILVKTVTTVIKGEGAV